MTPSRNIVRLTRSTAGKIKVLIVDDSIVIRHLVKEALDQDPALEVVGLATNGAECLQAIPGLQPDVVTLDIEMPVMDGLEALRQIRKKFPRLRTIMFSTLTARGASATFEALSLGADDYATKASNAGSLDRSLASLRSELIPKIKQFFAVPAPDLKPKSPVPRPVFAQAAARIRVVGIGSSTGEPQALAALIPHLPKDFPVPVLVVQHMPPMFTRLLAERLQNSSLLKVEEATEGMTLAPGRVVIAKGDFHLRVKRDGQTMLTTLDQSPAERSCRPSVDVLFRSLAEHYGNGVLAAVLTGMGDDGCRGTQALHAAGARCLVQDEASSVVWGMPGAISQAGLADQVLPLADIAPEITRRTMR
jgi:two-component system chemotaxis response regulator CheB